MLPTKRNKLNENQNGSVLLFILGILALLSLLGTALLLIARQEEESARQYSDAMRARFAAESGVETALAKLLNLDCSLSQLNQSICPIPKDAAIPMTYLLESSFGLEDSTGNGLKDLAGVVSETYQSRGDVFKLRVQSSQGKLNMNDSNSPVNIDTDPFEDQVHPDRDLNLVPEHMRPANGKDPDWLYPGQEDYDAAFAPGLNKPYSKAKGRLWGILKELTNVLFPDEALSGNGLSLGDRVAHAVFAARQARPGDRFSSLLELRDALVPSLLSKERYRVLEGHLTLDAWHDDNVLKPSFQWRISYPQTDFGLWACEGNCDFGSWYPFCVGDQWRGTQEPVLRPGEIKGHYNENGDWVSGVMPTNRRDALTATMNYDFDSNGTWSEPVVGDIRLYQPKIDDDAGYSDIITHDHDIYMYSDMQTRYFEKESRCPVEINAASRELIQALIAPVRGWYLQEAPSTWNGESPRARAEDWSQPTNIGVTGGTSMYWMGFPWLVGFRMGLYSMVYMERTGPGQPKVPVKYFAGESKPFHFPDQLQYYYMDAYSRDSVKINSFENYGIHGFNSGLFHSNKSARFGELKESRAFGEIVKNANGVSVAQKLAETIYVRIHGDGSPDQYNPFRTWEEFENFINDLADGDGINDLIPHPGDFDVYMAHALIANFNPNSRINDFNPNKRMYLHVDKSQLITNTTEFCLHPTGVFSIESLGEVRKGAGKEGARDTIIMSAKLWEIKRFGSQADFFKGYDEEGSGAKAFVNESTAVVNTAGADGIYKGHGLQSYPEPEATMVNYISASQYDGYLMLATLKPAGSELFGDSFPGDIGFHAMFDKSLNAETARGVADIQTDPGDEFWTPQTFRYREMELVTVENGAISFFYRPDEEGMFLANHPGLRPLCKKLSEYETRGSIAELPGNLYPDGAFSDAGRSLSYISELNIGDAGNDLEDKAIEGRRGSLQFWIKPGFDVAHSNRIRKFFTAPPRARTIATSKQILNDSAGFHLPEGHPAIPLLDGDKGMGFGMLEALHHDIQAMDYYKDFSLYYFARGGRKVTDGGPVYRGEGVLDDAVNLGYDPDPNLHDGNWLPTRAMFLLSGTHSCDSRWGKFLYGLGTDTMNQSWRWWAEPEQDDRIGLRQTPSVMLERANQFETRQWSHVALSWDWVGTAVEEEIQNEGTVVLWSEPNRYHRMVVNGLPIQEVRESKPLTQSETRPFDHPYGKIDGTAGFTRDIAQWYRDKYSSYDPTPHAFRTKSYPFRFGLYRNQEDGSASYMRFGESSSSPWQNIVADSTFDDCASSAAVKSELELGLEYQYGRYYNENNAEYRSPEFEVFGADANNKSVLDLISVCWTAYMPLPPDANYAPDHTRFNDCRFASSADLYARVSMTALPDRSFSMEGLADPMCGHWGGEWAPISIDILNPATGKWRYVEENGVTDKAACLNYAPDSMDPNWKANPLRWEKAKGDKLRFCVHFNIAEGQTLYTSPVFDDITFVFRMDKAVILRWEQGE